jgi:NTP pyrophosphatase (non-canonical NTP hydrolase)
MISDISKYILIKLASVEDTSVGKIIFPTDTSLSYKELWDEFKSLNKHKIIEQNPFAISFLYSEGSINIGDELLTEISLGNQLIIRSKNSSGIRTSIIKEILSPNIFLTMNSVYFLIDDNWRKKTQREEKLNKLFMTQFEEIWEEISQLDKEDDCHLSEAVCKFVEEFGELTTEINKLIGRKTSKESKEEIKANILEEAADSLQNLLLICNKLGITPEELLQEVKVKNIKWKSVIPERKKQNIK